MPGARFAEGDLLEIPFADDTFELAVCALAIAHLPRPADAIAELARVLRPGGRLIVSVLHPFLASLGWHAPFTDVDGRRGFVREHPHTHSTYLAALRAAGLALSDMAEPRPGPRARGRQAAGDARDPRGDRGGLRGAARGARPRRLKALAWRGPVAGTRAVG